MDYLTGLSGSGPAFPALLAAAMMRDAVANGLPALTSRACQSSGRTERRITSERSASA
ncbi:pyrroline-5-carboxylate reductase dimerization domain-containing protein [Rhizobium ruizarguesonis]